MKKIVLIFVNIIILNLPISSNSISIAKMDNVSDDVLDQTFARGLSEMSDAELENVSGQAGFAQVEYRSVPDPNDTEKTKFHVIQANLGLDIELYASIEKLKLGKYDLPSGTKTGAKLPILGYYFGNKDNEYRPVWDINFEGVQMGESPLDPVRLGGLIIRADFEEVNGQKILNRFIIGSDDVSGMIYVQRAKSFTGLMNTALAYSPDPLGGLLKYFPDTWTRRSYILNGEEHHSPSWNVFDIEYIASGVLGNVGRKGMLFKGKSEGHGFHIVMDKDNGIGIWAGFPISKIDSDDAFSYGK